MNIIETVRRQACAGTAAPVPGAWPGAMSGMGKRALITCAVALVAVVLVVALLPASALWAQDVPLSIKDMRVSVWPEYDDPRILVIYEGEFSDGSLFPQDVEFPAPVGAEVTMVCALVKPDDQHNCQLYKVRDEGDSLAIAYNLPIPAYYIEYYYDGISGQIDKEFTYNFLSPYRIDSLQVEVQQPLRSTGFSLSPEGAVAMSGGGDIRYHVYTFEDVAPGQTISVSASYTKSDTAPSVSDTSGQQGGSGNSGLLIVVGVIMALGAGAVGWYIMSNRQDTPRKATATAGRASRARIMKAEAPSAGPRKKDGKGSFCSHCGLKLDADDIFCPDCGAKVKRRG